MTLREEITPYRDSNGLVAPSRHNGTGASDNGPMYESEYTILLHMNSEPTDEYKDRIIECFGKPGLLYRRPLDKNPTEDGQEGPDDYHGVLAACVVLGLKDIGQAILNYGWKNWGFYNNQVPGSMRGKDGKINWEALMWRMPQLISLTYAAAGKASRLNPLLWFTDTYSALVILFSCLNEPINSADPRRLAWLLIQGLKRTSILCNLASKIWYRRLYRDYGPAGMREVAKVYYTDSHPFQRYWINE